MDFVSATTLYKNKQNFKLLIFKMNLPTYIKINLLLTSNIYLIVLTLKIRRRLKQTKVCHRCFTFSEKERPTKSSTSKKTFSPVCILLVRLVLMNIFYFM